MEWVFTDFLSYNVLEWVMVSVMAVLLGYSLSRHGYSAGYTEGYADGAGNATTDTDDEAPAELLDKMCLTLFHHRDIPYYHTRMHGNGVMEGETFFLVIAQGEENAVVLAQILQAINQLEGDASKGPLN